MYGNADWAWSVASCLAYLEVPFQMPFMPVASASLSHSGKCSCESTGAARCPFFAGQVWEVPLQSGFFKGRSLLRVQLCSLPCFVLLYRVPSCCFGRISIIEFPDCHDFICWKLFKSFNFFNEFWNVIFLWSKHRQPTGVLQSVCPDSVGSGETVTSLVRRWRCLEVFWA